MADSTTFRAWLDQAIAEAPHTACGIPLIDADSGDGDAAPLIRALTDIIIATCVRPAEQLQAA